MSDLKGSTSVLNQAHTVIYGDREKTYGDPGKNLRVVADLWTTYLKARMANRDGGEVSVNAEDVCHMMTLLKVARLTNTPGHSDSLVDICGYTALVERINDSQQKAQSPRTETA